jgi:hypothetical protein
LSSITGKSTRVKILKGNSDFKIWLFIDIIIFR